MTIGKELLVKLAGQNFVLLAEKAMFWKEESALLFADVHAGKATHFRKNGIPLTTDLLWSDLLKIEKVVTQIAPKKIIILGDLFHSTRNIENHFVEQWVENIGIPTELILGNHDVHSISSSRIITKTPYLVQNVFLSHEPVENDYLNIHGHLHPGISISGKARTQVHLPAFYVHEKFITLPAFGATTGKKMYPDLCKICSVVAITEEGLMSLD